MVQWIKSLIPEIGKWIKCYHNKTDYVLIRIAEENRCGYCGQTDTLEHTILVYERLRNKIGQNSS